MKKKAKVHIEIEYDLDKNGKVDMNAMGITTCEAAGDYEGLTLAMTTALAFGAPKGENNKKTFAIKLRLLRSTASALANCIDILKEHGALKDKDIDKSLSLFHLNTAVREVVNLITLGVGRVLGISNDEVERLNESEYKNPNEENDEQERKESKGDKGTGLESNGFEDYI